MPPHPGPAFAALAAATALFLVAPLQRAAGDVAGASDAPEAAPSRARGSFEELLQRLAEAHESALLGLPAADGQEFAAVLQALASEHAREVREALAAACAEPAAQEASGVRAEAAAGFQVQAEERRLTGADAPRGLQLLPTGASLLAGGTTSSGSPGASGSSVVLLPAGLGQQQATVPQIKLNNLVDPQASKTGYNLCRNANLDGACCSQLVGPCCTASTKRDPNDRFQMCFDVFSHMVKVVNLTGGQSFSILMSQTSGIGESLTLHANYQCNSMGSVRCSPFGYEDITVYQFNR